MSSRQAIEQGHVDLPRKKRWYLSRKRVFMTLDQPQYSKEAQYWSYFMTANILLSCALFIMSTFMAFKYQPASCSASHRICRPTEDNPCGEMVCVPEPIPLMWHLEALTIAIFSIDYVVRVALVHAVPQKLIYPEDYLTGQLAGQREPSGWRKTFDYLIQPMNIIDFLAIAPFYIHMALHGEDVELAVFQILRLLRMARAFKLGRYSEGMILLINTIKASLPALGLLAFFMVLMTVTFGAVIFYVEEGHFKYTEDSPDGAYYRTGPDGAESVSPFNNIMTAAYYVMITATTVGYGDISPLTPLGRVLAVIIAYLGIITIALPVAIVGKNFNDEFTKLFLLRQAERKLMAKDRAADEEGKADAQDVVEAGSVAVMMKEGVAGFAAPPTGALNPELQRRKSALSTVIRDQLASMEEMAKQLQEQLDEYEALGMAKLGRKNSMRL